MPSRLNSITQRPFVPLTLALALGIALHESLPKHSIVLLATAAVAILLAGVTLKRKYLANILLFIAAFFAGASLAQREHFLYPANDIAQFVSDDPHLTSLELKVIDDPQIVAASFGQVRPLPPRQVITGEILRVKTWTGWTDAVGELPITIDQPSPQLAAGQTIRVLGMLQRPRPAMNPGEFDWQSYYREQRINATLNIAKAGNIEILHDSAFSPFLWLRMKTRHLLAAGFNSKHAVDHAVLQAILLGDRDPQMRDVQEEFKDIGAAYQLSVSGLHIAILAGVLFWICRHLLLRPQYSVYITLAFTLLYAAVALPSHSGMRSVVLCVAVAFATLTHRPVERFQLLAMAVFALLLFHPLDLLSPGFQLSVAAVLGMAIFLPRLREFLLGLRDPDLAVLDQQPNRSLLHRFLIKIVAYLIRSLQFSLVAWISTLPLVAFHFGELSPYGIVAGIILLPITCAALIGGMLKILVTLIWPSSATFAATISGWPIVWTRHIVHYLASLPGGQILLPSPPIWLIVIYYLLLLLPRMLPESISPKKRRWLGYGSPALAVFLVLVLPLYPQLVSPAESGSLKVTLLSLGAGQCAVIEPPNHPPILIDAGSSTISDLTRQVIAPFLHHENKKQIAEIYLSHGDYDHISAVAELVASYNVKSICISPQFRTNSENNPIDLMLLDTLEKSDLPPQLLLQTDHRDLGNGASLDALWPTATSGLNSNNAGLVLRLTFAGKSILFPADIQDPGLDGVMKSNPDLHADILIAPHHGSSESLTPAFLKAVHPDVILSSNAAKLTNKQKKFDVMAGNIPLYRTSKFGAITVLIGKDGRIKITTFIKPLMVSAVDHRTSDSLIPNEDR